jgi:hypothetical protein
LIVIQNPPREMTKQDALELAAWLVAIADPTNEEFPAILAKIREGS